MRRGKAPPSSSPWAATLWATPPQEQLELVEGTAKNIVDMIAEGINVIVSHGNGPQVGMINNAFDYAAANDGKKIGRAHV